MPSVSALQAWIVASLSFLQLSSIAFAEPTVGIISVRSEDVSAKHEFVGRVEAINSVDIRSRISGFIEKQLFSDGQLIKSGQQLFLMDARGLQISLADAKAGLASAQASLDDAERRLARNQSLSGQSVTRATLEESQAARETAAAALQSAQARVSQAELDLSYATVISPIDGRIGAANLSVGNFVGDSSSVLARIVEIDPVRVVFSVSDRTILDLRAAAPEASKEELAGRYRPGLRLANGQAYPERGTIEFFGNEIDEQTGTLAVRALFPNRGSLLTPGQFVTVVIAEAEPELRPVAPLGAVQQDRAGKFVFLVDEKNEVALRRIEVSTQTGGNWIVDSGLKDGDKLIVEGLQNVAEGVAVKAVPASSEAEPSPAGAAK
ncbi:efflux RND transporter periplasmic adaptor subunit [Rhizobium cauense]|uniref:efflux RND transporter periplasmic adaptor subunit n=1 Tax=Rhizobium cauense TaxID=1166683 RepID=UPI001CB769BC|nr:efflux RND transporter periplasmic adaptor subunit [Rhizobium cauense]